MITCVEAAKIGKIEGIIAIDKETKQLTLSHKLLKNIIEEGKKFIDKPRDKARYPDQSKSCYPEGHSYFYKKDVYGIEIAKEQDPYTRPIIDNENPMAAFNFLSDIASIPDFSFLSGKAIITEEEIKDREEIRTESSITISSLQKLKEETSTLFKEKSKAAQGEEIEAMQEERSYDTSSHVKKLEISREKRSEGKLGERSKKGKSEGELGIGGRNII